MLPGETRKFVCGYCQYLAGYAFGGFVEDQAEPAFALPPPEGIPGVISAGDDMTPDAASMFKSGDKSFCQDVWEIY